MQDFVKWRGAVFHRFTLALVDPSPDIRQLAEFLLADALATKVAFHVTAQRYGTIHPRRTG